MKKSFSQLPLACLLYPSFVCCSMIISVLASNFYPKLHYFAIQSPPNMLIFIASLLSGIKGGQKPELTLQSDLLGKMLNFRSIFKVNSGSGAEFTLRNGNRNLNWKIFVKLLNRCNTHDIVNMPATEDKATQRCDLSASWPLMGRCYTVSLFCVTISDDTGRGAPEE